MTMTHDEILALISVLREDDMIRVRWLDACETWNVDEKHLTENSVYATYKENVARFWCIIEDQLYRKQHIVLKLKMCGVEKWKIVSIPLSSIVTIEKLPQTMRLKTFHEIGIPYLISRQVVPVTDENGVGEHVERN